jgi:hypothetical protein
MKIASNRMTPAGRAMREKRTQRLWRRAARNARSLSPRPMVQ